MDIQEIKTWAKNKIESDALAREVRRKIRETAWEKQNQREGFRESFKPLISQFEKPEDDKTKNIFTQNQEMLRNQLAITEGVRANQRAITQGFNQLERLADVRDLPGVEAIEQQEQLQPAERPKRNIAQYNIERHFNDQDRQVLQNLDYPRPNDFFNTDPRILRDNYIEVTNDKNAMGNGIGALKRTKNKTKEQDEELELNIMQHAVLSKYQNILKLYLETLNLQVGEGINNPYQLIKRLKLLGGSIMAGNNGVVPEFTQIANYLNSIKVLPTKKLNKMLKTMKIYLGIN